MTSGSSGTGNGTVSYTVAANTSTSPRTGTHDDCRCDGDGHAGRRVPYAVAPTTQSVLAVGGSHSATVTTSGGCSWTGVSNNTSWITVTSGSSGTDDGTVSYTVAANTGAARTGTLTIAGLTTTVTQAGACAYTVAPTTQSVLVGGGSHSAAVSDDQRLWLDRRQR